MNAGVSRARACLQAGFKLAVPRAVHPASATGRHVLRRFLLRACGLVLVLAPVAVAASPLPASAAGAAAEPPRLPAGRLQPLDGFLRQATDAQGYLGAVSLVYHDGAVVHSRAYGFRDLARRSPMREDSIFRLYSMTKTVTTVAVLMLVEEGRLALDAPVEKTLPEFSGMQVFVAGSPDFPQLRATRSKLTLRHLLTHTAGFATAGGEEANTLLERADLHGSRDLAEFSVRLARVPLAVEPGTRFRYDGTQIEIAARMVEVASGQRFDDFVQQRILHPLQMHDTGFSMPAGKRDRIVDITVMVADGSLVLDSGPS